MGVEYPRQYEKNELTVSCFESNETNKKFDWKKLLTTTGRGCARKSARRKLDMMSAAKRDKSCDY